MLKQKVKDVLGHVPIYTATMLKIYGAHNINYRFSALAVNFET